MIPYNAVHTPVLCLFTSHGHLLMAAVHAAIWAGCRLPSPVCAGPTLRVRSKAASCASFPAPPSFRHHLFFPSCSLVLPLAAFGLRRMGCGFKYSPLCLLDSASPGKLSSGA